MKKKKIFVDSDLVLSSLILSKGAAFFLLNEADLGLFVSNISIIEIKRGLLKLKLDNDKFQILLKYRLRTIRLRDSNEGLEKIKADFGKYVFDQDDAHIVAGARRAKVRVILTYNIRHFKVERLKRELNILISTPAQFLQYLRSLN